MGFHLHHCSVKGTIIQNVPFFPSKISSKPIHHELRFKHNLHVNHLHAALTTVARAIAFSGDLLDADVAHMTTMVVLVSRDGSDER